MKMKEFGENRGVHVALVSAPPPPPDLPLSPNYYVS